MVKLLVNAETGQMPSSTLDPLIIIPAGPGGEQLDTYSVTILGNVEECRTEAEVSRDGRVVAIVYESSDGWHTEVLDTRLRQPKSNFQEAVRSARKTLSHYVNRQGNNPPQNATRGAFALWLMMKDDGTAMGISPQGDVKS